MKRAVSFFLLAFLLGGILIAAGPMKTARTENE